MNEPGIYIDCAKLRKLIIYSLVGMTKAERMLYAERAVVESGEVIADFVMAYKFQEERNEGYQESQPMRAAFKDKRIHSFRQLIPRYTEDAQRIRSREKTT